MANHDEHASFLPALNAQHLKHNVIRTPEKPFQTSDTKKSIFYTPI